MQFGIFGGPADGKNREQSPILQAQPYQKVLDIRELRVATLVYAGNYVEGDFPGVDSLPNGRHVYVLAEGRLVNLAAGDGHPAEIMDMSFAIQALSAKYLVEHEGKLTQMLIDVPREVDLEVANRKLKFLGITIDKLTPEQEAYLNKSAI